MWNGLLSSANGGTAHSKRTTFVILSKILVLTFLSKFVPNKWSQNIRYTSLDDINLSKLSVSEVISHYSEYFKFLDQWAIVLAKEEARRCKICSRCKTCEKNKLDNLLSNDDNKNKIDGCFAGKCCDWGLHTKLYNKNYYSELLWYKYPI